MKVSRWKNLLKKLSPTTSICKICFKDINDISLFHFVHNNVKICDECFNKFKVIDKELEIEGVKGEIIYEYDDFFRELLYKYKGCDDYELKDVFLDRRRLLKYRFKNYTLINAPSNESEDKRRGYNHVVEMYRCLGLEIISPIYKNVEFKQSDLSSSEREKVSTRLSIKDDVNLNDKKILIVDDVLTTGNTLKAMINLIKTKNPKSVRFLVMAYHTKNY